MAQGTMKFDILLFRCRYAQLPTVIKANILRIIDDPSLKNWTNRQIVNLKSIDYAS